LNAKNHVVSLVRCWCLEFPARSNVSLPAVIVR
jgi:hypothetical protein